MPEYDSARATHWFSKIKSMHPAVRNTFRPLLFAGIVGTFVLAATIANLVMLPHPTWFAAIGIVGIVLAAVAAGAVASSSTRR